MREKNMNLNMNLKDMTDNPRKESNLVWREPRHSIRFYLFYKITVKFSLKSSDNNGVEQRNALKILVGKE